LHPGKSAAPKDRAAGVEDFAAPSLFIAMLRHYHPTERSSFTVQRQGLAMKQSLSSSLAERYQ
jgi:hypothetical protein